MVSEPSVQTARYILGPDLHQFFKKKENPSLLSSMLMSFAMVGSTFLQSGL